MKPTISEADRTHYKEQGFLLVRGALSEDQLAPMENRFLALANDKKGASYSALDDPALVSDISSDRDLESYLYAEIRQHPELEELAKTEALSATVTSLLGDQEAILLEKIPFRIDCPNVNRELAIWHQDHFYVRGSLDTITAWIPLLKTTYLEGCLLVMPASHADGPIPHDVNALKKKWYPSNIFDREVRYVEMNRGDVLFFHSCLLHSSGNNLSETIRFSIQARYQPAAEASDPGMGQRIAL